MEGLKNEVICQDESIKGFLPFEPLHYREAIVGALTREEQDNVRTSWFGAYPPAHELAIKLHELDPGPQYTARLLDPLAQGFVAALRVNLQDRRQGRLVHAQLDVAAARMARPGASRRRHVAGPQEPVDAHDIGRHRFLADRGPEARHPAPAARRDEASRQGVARVQDRSGRATGTGSGSSRTITRRASSAGSTGTSSSRSTTSSSPISSSRSRSVREGRLRAFRREPVPRPQADLHQHQHHRHLDQHARPPWPAPRRRRGRRASSPWRWRPRSDSTRRSSPRARRPRTGASAASPAGSRARRSAWSG